MTWDELLWRLPMAAAAHTIAAYARRCGKRTQRRQDWGGALEALQALQAKRRAQVHDA